MKIQFPRTIKPLDTLFYGVLFMMLLDIPYIKVTFSAVPVVAVELALFLLIALYVLLGQIKLAEPSLLLLVYIGYFFVVTFLGSGHCGEFVMDMFPILFQVVLISAIMQTNSLKYIDRMTAFLFAVTFLDMLTIIAVPGGLYQSNSSARNWLLGYETNRMHYSFPLLVMYYYSLARRNLPLKPRRWIVPIVVFVDMSLSGGDAGSLALLVYIFLASSGIVLKKRSGKLYKGYVTLMYQYKLYFVLFLIVFSTFVVFQNSTLLITIAVKLLSKSATLSNRIPIWNRCMQEISEHFLFGLGNLSPADYQRITGGFANPHNIIFSYMLTGGVIGLLLLILYVVTCFRGLKASADNLYLVLGIYLILFLGLTSSSLSFSPFLFAFCIMIYDGNSKRKKRYYKVGVTHERS